MHSEKYAKLREAEELKFLSQIYEECTSFDPRQQRMTVKQLATILTQKDDHLLFVCLKVSQNSAIERYDMQAADNHGNHKGVWHCSLMGTQPSVP